MASAGSRHRGTESGDHRPTPTDQYHFGAGESSARRLSTALHYTVLMEPIATDAIFVAPRARRSDAAVSWRWPAARARTSQRHGYLLVDHTGSLFNPVAQRVENSLRGHVRASDDPARRRCASRSRYIRTRFAARICNCRCSIRESRSSREQITSQVHERIRQSREHRALPENALRLHARSCPARAQPIRSRIFFSCAAPATANISPRP